MARRPNYSFERRERERAKAAKKAARALIRAEKAELRKAERAGEAGPEAGGEAGIEAGAEAGIEAGGESGLQAGDGQPPKPAAEAEQDSEGNTVES